jgi:hypothetical protein
MQEFSEVGEKEQLLIAIVGGRFILVSLINS